MELASLGLGKVAPNPMVGCVIVHKNKIIGEGYHEKFGAAHAEVNAINSVSKKNQPLLTASTMYLNLEPCTHFGKTPPCADLIIEKKIPRVVIANIDSNPLIKGKGIKRLTNAGINVKTSVLEKEGNELNKRFFKFHQNKRPYIVLKWAETKDGFISKFIIHNSELKKNENWISNEFSTKLVHKWRSEEQAILAGTNTALTDNPKLTVREWKGKNPLRLVMDKDLKLPSSLHLFDKKTPTAVFTSKKRKSTDNLEFVYSDFDKNLLRQIVSYCYEKQIQSIIVEGGSGLLNSFIQDDLWDEARIFTGNKFFNKGITAPEIKGKLNCIEKIGDDELKIIRNR